MPYNTRCLQWETRLIPVHRDTQHRIIPGEGAGSPHACFLWLMLDRQRHKAGLQWLTLFCLLLEQIFILPLSAELTSSQHLNRIPLDKDFLKHIFLSSSQSVACISLA